MGERGWEGILRLMIDPRAPPPLLDFLEFLWSFVEFLEFFLFVFNFQEFPNSEAIVFLCFRK